MNGFDVTKPFFSGPVVARRVPGETDLEATERFLDRLWLRSSCQVNLIRNFRELNPMKRDQLELFPQLDALDVWVGIRDAVEAEHDRISELLA